MNAPGTKRLKLTQWLQNVLQKFNLRHYYQNEPMDLAEVMREIPKR